MASGLDGAKEDLKEVEAALQTVQDPGRKEMMQIQRWNLRAELRQLERTTGACSPCFANSASAWADEHGPC